MSEQHTFPNSRGWEGSGTSGSIVQGLPGALRALGAIVSYDWGVAVQEYPVARRAQRFFRWVAEPEPGYKSGISVPANGQAHRPTAASHLRDVTPRDVVAYFDGINRVVAERRFPNGGESSV